MWKFASNCIGSGIRGGGDLKMIEKARTECTDDEISSNCSSSGGEDEGLECPICWEYFNIVENVPYVLWCGHSVCKNCILELQWDAIIKFLPLQLPLFISCPWCNYLSPRLIYKGNLKFPSKNYFLLSMVESRNSEREKSHSSSSFCHDNYCLSSSSRGRGQQHNNDDDEMERSKCVGLLVELMTKFPLVVIFMVIVLYAVPASATILALYVVITVLFAVPSILILYFAYPSLDWLVREIIT